MAGQINTPAIGCAQCAEPITTSAATGRPRSYCSAKCRWAAQYEAKKLKYPGGYVAPSQVPKKSKPPTPCEACGSLTNRPRFCSTSCSMANRHGLPSFQAEQRDCKECAAPFRASRRDASYCSRACRRSSANRKSTAIRRARQASLPREYFDPVEIFRRDEWKCYLCGRKTRADLRGAYDELSPELDHIVPISKGGPHTRKNTACSCHHCNSRKGDKMLAEFSRLSLDPLS